MQSCYVTSGHIHLALNIELAGGGTVCGLKGFIRETYRGKDHPWRPQDAVLQVAGQVQSPGAPAQKHLTWEAVGGGGFYS